MRAMLRWWPPVLAAAILVFALNGRFWAADEDKEKKANPELDKKIGDLVKTIINRGADMHNLYRDTAGCYRFYQGSLVTLRPFLDGHPDLQKAVDKALADSNRANTVLQRGLILNGALKKIYTKLNPEARKGAKDKKDKSDTDKGPEDKAPRDDSKKDKDTKDKDGDKDKDSKDSKKDKDKNSKDSKKDKDSKDSKKDKDSKDSKKDKDKNDKDEASNQPVRDKQIPKDLLKDLR
jgi:hypothetical protein